MYISIIFHCIIVDDLPVKNFFHSALKIITLFYILTFPVRIVASDGFGNVCVLLVETFFA